MAEYTGKRKPRGNDIASWRKYFEVHPEKQEEYPKEWARANKITYTGVRKPRDNDPAKWKIYYNVHPDKRPDPKPKPKPKPKPRVKKQAPPVGNTAWADQGTGQLSPKEQRLMQRLLGIAAWSPLLGATLMVQSVDIEKDRMRIMIHKHVTLSFTEFLALDAEHFSDISSHGAHYKKYLHSLEAQNTEAFRQFQDFLTKDKKTTLRDWLNSYEDPGFDD